MALKTMLNKLTKARDNYNKIKKELGGDLGEAIAAHLAKHIPDGYFLQWKGGTPSFNDGEPCTFSCYEAHLLTQEVLDKGDEGWDLSSAYKKYGVPDKEEHYMEEDWSAPYTGKPREKTIKRTYIEHGFPEIEGYSKEKMEALLEAWAEVYDDDVMLTAFGDGFKITLSNNGEYEHDDWYNE